MASLVFYKFKSRKDESRVTFDGTGISVFDLKKEIILANNLGKANDFDLVILDPSSNEEYTNDSTIIPRASSVVVKRVFAKPGKGKAAMYISGAGASSSAGPSDPKTGSSGGPSQTNWHRGNITKRFDGREEPPKEASKPAAPAVTIQPSNITKEDEAAAMAAMFQAQTANWEETQEKMSQLVSRLSAFLVYSSSVILMNFVCTLRLPVCCIFFFAYSAQRIYTNPRGGAPGGRGGKPFTPHHHQPERPLPPSYVCYRCGQKGHWIQDCPTNNDRDYDNRPRIKRTTGIPRSFLKAVDNPSTGPLGQGVMVTPEGGYVVAQPDSASWQKQVARVKGLSEADIRDRTPSDPSLACPIDHKLFKDAKKTPCCGTLYCEECIESHLLERDFICPNCGRKIASLDKLIIDKPMRTRVHDYIDKEIEKSRQQESSASDENKTASGSTAGNANDPSYADGQDQDFYLDQQPNADYDVSQMVAASIPQLQAQISQITVMLNNPSLPPHVRQQTEMKHRQLQIELQQAQMAAALIQASNVAAAFNIQQGQQQQQQQHQQQQQINVGQQQQQYGMGMMGGGGMPLQHQQQHHHHQNQWTNPFPNQQPAGQDSAYQRLPLNNRRRNLKRERPSDFLEVAGNDQGVGKMPRHWE
ncbi:DWNN domain-containing protein [Cristinia sonorae]|uniref:DWNN domain-containing protein n=1 Tax=Cristinia sonorae TaxID=1940300 RepID=A0A8K0XMY9_9AGAR|nr:DWNN domain-containing protein [Cristinia sonorae]